MRLTLVFVDGLFQAMSLRPRSLFITALASSTITAEHSDSVMAGKPVMKIVFLDLTDMCSSVPVLPMKAVLVWRIVSMSLYVEAARDEMLVTPASNNILALTPSTLISLHRSTSSL